MQIVDLRAYFDRETQILEVCGDILLVAADAKTQTEDACCVCRIDLTDGRITHELRLDYARLYEAFEYSSLQPDFFDCVNVLSDYRVRLRRIRKSDLTMMMDILIVPEGEILCLIPLNDQWFLAADEVDYHPVYYLYQWGMDQRIPITDPDVLADMDGFVQIRTEAGIPVLYIRSGSCYYACPAARLISDVRTDGTCHFQKTDMTDAAVPDGPSEDGFGPDDADRLPKLLYEDEEIVIRSPDLVVTAYYREKKHLEDITFHEYCGIYRTDGGESVHFEGKAERIGDRLFLEHSFLAL